MACDERVEVEKNVVKERQEGYGVALGESSDVGLSKVSNSMSGR